MSTSDTTESPLMNASIIHSALSAENQNDGIDPDTCCAQWMPAGDCGLYLKFLLIISGVFGGGSFGLYKLCEYLSR